MKLTTDGQRRGPPTPTVAPTELSNTCRERSLCIIFRARGSAEETMSYAAHKAAQQSSDASSSSSSADDAQKLQERNEYFMAQAKRDGKEHMLTMGEGGARLLNESDVGATLDKYSWTQTDDEVIVKVKVPAGTKSKAVKLDVHSKTLKLEVLGDKILDGSLYKNVDADECTFTIEDDGDGRIVIVTLQKLQKTSANAHWKCVCIGEPEISTNFGPAIMTADPNDPNDIARMLQEGGLG